MPALTVIAVAALVMSALLGGMHLTGLGGLNPAMRSLDGPTYLAVKQAADREFPKIAKPVMLTSVVLAVVLVVAAALVGDAFVIVLGIVASGALIGTLLAILRGDLPINRAMTSWTATTLPADWAMQRTAWEKSFAIRAIANAVAVAALAVAVGVVR